MNSVFPSILRRLLVCAVVAAGWTAHGVRAAELQTSLAEDGRSFVLDVTGVFKLRAGFSAVVERGNRRFELNSKAALGKPAIVSETEATAGGPAELRQVTLPFETDACELVLRHGRMPGVAGVIVQSGVRNTGTEPLRLVSTSPVTMVGGSSENASRRVFLNTKMASSIQHGYEALLDNLCVNKTPLRLFGETFSRGIGSQAPTDMKFPLGGKFTRFQCVVGVDDSGSGSVTFEVHADGKKLFDSGQMLSGQPSKIIDLDVIGVQELQLVVTDAGDGPNYDWANWADACLTPVTDIESVLPSADAPVIRFDRPISNWLASPMLGDSGAMTPRVLDRTFEFFNLREAGGVYNPHGSGLFFGPVGTPICYLSGRIGNAGNQRATLDLDCAMDSVEVQPGQICWGQQVALISERPELAQEQWISWVATSHQARSPRDSMSGWLSWYWLGQKVSERNLTEMLDFVANSGGSLRPQVIQIDDGYQRPDGQPGFNEKFPSGMEGMAAKISANGAMPGLMIRLKNNESAKVENFLETFRQATASGFRYLKIAEFGVPADPVGGKTSFQKKRELFQAIRQASGEDSYLLTVGNGVDRACVGAMDACRVNDSMERHKMPTGFDDALRSLPFNRRWFTVDTDCYYLATDVAKLPPVSGGWPMVRTWLSITGLTSGNAMTSEPWQWDSMKPFLRHAEILTPPSVERARALDLGTQAGLERVVGTVHRPWADWTVAMLWNPGNQSKSVTLDFAKAGMDTSRSYAVWSFWENRFLGIAEKSWTTSVLAPYHSEHLCFTPISDDPMKPQVVGSNLHIWCGAAEFSSMTSLHGAMEIQFSDAGARSGDVFVRCDSRPVLRSATGCKVASIHPAGETIWRISVTDRQRGVVQSLEFGLFVPVTSQHWFWVLLAMLASSLVFGIWRYVEKIRIERQVLWLQQKSALDEERARIARDLHDEIGANLARIVLLTEMPDHSIAEPKQVRHQLDRILQAARGLTRQLDSVVWSVDPANDTLESLARYLHGHAQDYLAIAKIRCRFEASKLPEIPLHSTLRHHLLMISKEALHNIIKHSHAKTATIRLALTDSQLMLSIEDDGCGCSPPADGRRRGNGLNNMSKRAHAAGGVIEIRPGTDGLGTVVTLTLNLSSPFQFPSEPPP